LLPSKFFVVYKEPEILGYSIRRVKGPIGFIDSGFAGDQDDMKSTLGNVFLLCSAIVS